MTRQEPSRFFNAVHDGFGELFLTEEPAHSSDEFLPKGVAALLMNAGVANDREFAGFGREEKENAVAMTCFRHAHRGKMFLGRGFGFLDVAHGNKNPDFARSFFFRGCNRGDDSFRVEFREKFFGFHGRKSLVTNSRQRRLHRIPLPLR